MSRTVVVAIAALLLIVPLAGCIGGSGDGGGLLGEDAGGEGPVENTSAEPETQEVDSGDRPHVHPRWDDPATGEYDSFEKIAVVDREFELNPESQSCPHTQSESRSGGLPICLGGVEFGPGEWSDGTPKIVPPGTANVTVQVNWSSDASIEGVNAFYRHSQNEPGKWQGQISGGPIDESGGTVTVPIESRDRTEWPDNGHAEESAWQFAVESWGNPAGAANGAVRVADGTIHVRVIAERVEGELPIEPAHPDYWVATDTYQVGYLNGSTNSTVVAGPFTVDQGSPQDVQTNRPGAKWVNSPGLVGYRFRGTPPRVLKSIPVEHEMRAVPPQSQLLFAVVRADISSQANPPQICALVSDEPANRWRTATPIGECQTVSGGGETWTFTQELQQEDWDSLYAGSPNSTVASRYTFFVHVRPQLPHENVAAPSAFQVNELDVGFFVTDDARAEVPDWGLGPRP